jgi:hypothetical protein
VHRERTDLELGPFDRPDGTRSVAERLGETVEHLFGRGRGIERRGYEPERGRRRHGGVGATVAVTVTDLEMMVTVTVS